MPFQQVAHPDSIAIVAALVSALGTLITAFVGVVVTRNTRTTKRVETELTKAQTQLADVRADAETREAVSDIARKFQEQYNALQADFHKLQKEFTEERVKNAELQGLLNAARDAAALQTQRNDRQADTIAEMKVKLEDLQRRVENLDTEIAIVTEQKNAAEKEAERLQEQLNSLRRVTEQQIAELKAKLEQKDAEIAALRIQLKGKTDEPETKL